MSMCMSATALDMKRHLECILKAQDPSVSMRPPPCTDADDLLRSQVVLFSDNYYINHKYTLPYTHIKMRR